MGRLFWKFFFAFWLAWLTAGIGVGTIFWLRETQRQAESANQPSGINVRHIASMVSVAANLLPRSGVAGLRDFIHALRQERFPPIYAVDDQNRELLGRQVSPEILHQARTLYADSQYPDAIRMVSADDGRRYLLFVPSPENGFADNFRMAMPPNPPDLLGLASPAQRPPPGRDNRRPPRNPPSPIAPLIAGSIASLVFSALLAWYFAKPIRNLRNAFQAVAQGRLDTRIGLGMGRRRDELSDLGRDFDHMAKQIGNLVGAQQHLLHDVSHELRSPLARIQAAIGLAQQQPEKLPATLERIERESQRISDLVGELLMLSRLEAGVDKRTFEAVNIADLLADIVEDVGFEAQRNGISLEYPGIGDIRGYCLPELLHRAVENILRNAVQHCRRDGSVILAADFERNNARLRIRVEDMGPGVPDRDLAAIFQPFFRSGKPTKAQSTGLGLTIAQRAIEAHGGRIGAENREAGGLRVMIDIPFPSRQTS
ncbi:ATP-binding protein [Methylomonas koyamae]|uniref:histidine kinase n=1 Tax=Methylomonas koyamae TaxID=702114 RepID=A0A291IGG1_9GAMM|nr:ATP-binding protein [Methylomonas koyamae]ATG89278.1 sensor histidine kinase [Methylomonas koyamae]OAI27049.1 two-component sensor histidine kinase [Methylomonas koyamae]